MSSARLHDTRSIYKNMVYFYTLARNNLKRKKKKTISYIIASKNKILRNKFNKRNIRLVY